MDTLGSSRGLTLPAQLSPSPPQLIFRPPLFKPADAMNCGGGGVGGAGGDCGKNPPPRGVHPRYVPKRGAVLKGIVRGMLRCFVPNSPLAGGPANSSGRRVRPAPAEEGGDGAEQGK